MVGRGREDLILFLAANPCGMSRLALDQECAAIERELRLVARAGAMAFVAKWAVTPDEMMRHLIELEPTVIHFSGHGSQGAAPSRGRARRDTADANDRSGICLQGENGSSQLVDGRALMKVIRSAASLARVVVLNACYSEAQAAAVSGVVDCVVGMTGQIEDDAARSFAVGFYRALGNGRSVANAVDQATAILAIKHPAYEHLPCYRTRSGVDASRLTLRVGAPGGGGGAAVASPDDSEEHWAQRFEAVVSLCREAQERLDSDPLSAALRAQLAIGHIADYLQERELGPVDSDEPLDAKLKRIEAAIEFPPMVATHFASVRAHTSSMIDVARMAVGPRPSFMGPCLDSLAIVVEWFLWDYLDPTRDRASRFCASSGSGLHGAAATEPAGPPPSAVTIAPRRRRRASSGRNKPVASRRPT